jgi:hypothetical protein
VIGSELEMEAKPDEGAMVSRWGAGVAVWTGIGAPKRFLAMVFVGNVGEEILGVADSPGGVVEVGRCYRWVGGDANPPSLIEKQRRAQIAGVKHDFGCVRGVGRSRRRVAMRDQQVSEPRIRARMGRLGDQLRRRTDGRQSQRKNRTMQEGSQVPRAFHFNSDGCRFQAEHDGIDAGLRFDCDSGT